MTLPTPSQVALSTSVYWFETLPPGDVIYTGLDCPEPVVYNTELCRDTGFEQQIVTLTTGGPNTGTQIPAFENSCASWYEWQNTSGFGTPTCATANEVALTGWVQTGIVNGKHEWRVSTVAPRTGTYHIRFSSTNPPAAELNPVAVAAPACVDDWSAVRMHKHQIVFRCSSGDTFNWSLYVKEVTAGSSTGTNGWRMLTQFMSSDGAPLSTGSTNWGVVGGSYSQITSSFVAPAGTVYAMPSVFYLQNNSDADVVVDADDASVTVTP